MRYIEIPVQMGFCENFENKNKNKQKKKNSQISRFYKGENTLDMGSGFKPRVVRPRQKKK